MTLVALASGCGASSSHGVAGAKKTIVHRCAPGAERAVGDRRVAWAAVARRTTTAYRAPGRGAIERFGLRNVNRVPTVFSVVAERLDTRCRPTWLRVGLPLRPNGITGWVRASSVLRLPVHTRITVDLSERKVRLYRNGRLVLESRAAVGSSATPTPVGRYYVNQRLVPRDPTGPFGPGAVGISAFSSVLTGWTQGGPIAIHGTNEPWSIG
ncbi:MAG TPA: L,D-transpeptidase, partial [Gaiellaceae bacterium]|nr:L,D-transpeptidase [Gaiellaceae bacterium]